MAKSFAPRVSKNKRKTIDLVDKLDYDLTKRSDAKLLQGARLDELNLKDITVKDQVRTKFNDSSIKELAENIKTNGLIQPLVVHRTGKIFTLICGERRFRAMSSIKMKSAPCFILEDKTDDELMAIQFSENSSREELHYIDKADGILNYQKTTKSSERKIVAALGISKSEVHRSLIIAKMSKKIKEAAKRYNTEKYVLVEFDALPKGSLRNKVDKAICSGEVTKRAQLRKLLKAGTVVSKGTKKTRTRKDPALPSGMSANALLKLMKTKSKDKKTQELLKKLVEEANDLVEL